jgi:poly-gamma-glutamate capsule biosynthesis protein CapA/YwtB (metallophosphatase superfamily)
LLFSKGGSVLKKRNYIVYFVLFAFLFGVSAFAGYTINSGRDREVSKIGVDASPGDIEPTSSPDEPIATPVPEPVITEVVISSAGDVTLGTDDNFYKPTSLPAMLQQQNYNYAYFFENVAHIFKEDDLTIVNLENPFTDHNIKDRPDKRFHFKGSPELAKALTLGHIEAVNIANNHIYDYGIQGFNDTITTLKSNNINYFGEGIKWITTIKGQKFGFLGYQGWSDNADFLAALKRDIEELKNQDAVIIINFHWGIERDYVPNSVQRRIAHFSIDNGADLIIGHHPHVIQGIEIYKDRYIAYSLANFCFGGNSNPKDKDTFILQNKFIFTDDKLTSIGIRVIPTSVSSVSHRNDYRPTPMEGAEKERLLKKLNKLTEPLGYTASEEYFFIDIEL